MKYSTDKKLIELAKRTTWNNPVIQVLREDLKDRYSPLVKLIEAQLQETHDRKKLLLPELRKYGNKSIGIFSDYGGESNDSLYNTYAFLICGWNHSWGVLSEMKKVRDKYKLNNKEISFKDLRYGPIKRSLKEYLNVMDFHAIGFLYTVIIEKGIASLFADSDKDLCKLIREKGFGDWKPKVLEKLLRVTHIAGYLTALLSENGQKIFWMTDHDAIAPNEQKGQDILKLFDSVLTLYTKNSYERIGGAVPFAEKDTYTLDLLSMTDLVAGSIEHYFTRNDKMDKLTVKEEADIILQWLGHNGLGLKKQTLLIQKEGDGVKGSSVIFEPKEKPKDLQMVPVLIH